MVASSLQASASTTFIAVNMQAAAIYARSVLDSTEWWGLGYRAGENE